MCASEDTEYEHFLPWQIGLYGPRRWVDGEWWELRYVGTDGLLHKWSLRRGKEWRGEQVDSVERGEATRWRSLLDWADKQIERTVGKVAVTTLDVAIAAEDVAREAAKTASDPPDLAQEHWTLDRSWGSSKVYAHPCGIMVRWVRYGRLLRPGEDGNDPAPPDANVWRLSVQRWPLGTGMVKSELFEAPVGPDVPAPGVGDVIPDALYLAVMRLLCTEDAYEAYPAEWDDTGGDWYVEGPEEAPFSEQDAHYLHIHDESAVWLAKWRADDLVERGFRDVRVADLEAQMDREWPVNPPREDGDVSHGGDAGDAAVRGIEASEATSASGSLRSDGVALARVIASGVKRIGRDAVRRLLGESGNLD